MSVFQTHIPEIRFTKLNAETTVTIGGAVVYNLDIYVPFGSISDYKVSSFHSVKITVAIDNP